MALQYKSLIFVGLVPYSFPSFIDTLQAGIIEGANDGRGRGRQGKALVLSYTIHL